jgi:hypothetical protein
MIETYKILHNINDPNTARSILTKSTNMRTRGHSLKLEKPLCRRNIRLHSFSHRIVNTWNSLTEQIVSAPSVHAFENRLDKHWANHPLRFNPEEHRERNRAEPRSRDLDIEDDVLRPEPP